MWSYEGYQQGQIHMCTCLAKFYSSSDVDPETWIEACLLMVIGAKSHSINPSQTILNPNIKVCPDECQILNLGPRQGLACWANLEMRIRYYHIQASKADPGWTLIH